jgi:uncharacterized protein (TIGR02757 family)
MGRLKREELRELLEIKYIQYNTPDFVVNDPLSVPHSFTLREDIEISAFLTSAIAWGNRLSIIRSANRMMDLMGRSPFEYVIHYESGSDDSVMDFVHRTFSGEALDYFLRRLRFIYTDCGGLEQVFTEGYQSGGIYGALEHFRELFVEPGTPGSIGRHISDVVKGSAAKRLNLFLMWMVRQDRSGVHFGLWKGIPASALMIPLDTHVGRVARDLGMLTRKTNDWQAVEELTIQLRKFDPDDPCRFDFSLFGLGIFDKF